MSSLSKVGIYLSVDNGKDGFSIPVLPPELPFDHAANGEEFDIVGKGKVNVSKPKNLEEISFESFFPGMVSHLSDTEFIKPKLYVDKILKWMKEEKVVRFLYVGKSITVNILTTIEKFVPKEEYGTSDVAYEISFKKYVDYSFKKMKIVKSKSKNIKSVKKKIVKSNKQPRQNKKVVPKTYSLVSGDSLWKIALKYTNNGNNFPALQKLNGIKKSQLRRLPIGLKVKLPPEWFDKKK